MTYFQGIATLDERKLTREESQLALLVIEKALADAYVAKPSMRTGFSSSTVSETERFEARQFCEARQGPWAESRRLWCHAAGIEPSALMRRIQQLKAKAAP